VGFKEQGRWGEMGGGRKGEEEKVAGEAGGCGWGEEGGREAAAGRCGRQQGREVRGRGEEGDDSRKEE